MGFIKRKMNLFSPRKKPKMRPTRRPRIRTKPRVYTSPSVTKANRYTGRETPVRSKKEKFKGERTLNPVKIEINKKIAEEFAKVNGTEGFYIVLESEALLTIKSLKAKGITKIEIPNPTTAYGKIKKANRGTYRMWLSDYLDLIEEVGHMKVYGIWFDYCCSIDGNVDMKPKEDIKKYFALNLPAKKSVLGYTFCYRKGTKVEFTHQDMYVIDNHIQQTAYEHGYVAIKLPYGRMYKGSMFFGMYKIEKRQDAKNLGKSNISIGLFEKGEKEYRERTNITLNPKIKKALKRSKKNVSRYVEYLITKDMNEK